MHCRVCILLLALLSAAIACRTDAPVPLPDAGIPAGLTLTVSPPSLVVRPGSSGRLRFGLRSGDGAAVPNYLLSFAAVDEEGQPATVNARLSAPRVLTEDDGTAAVEVLIGDLGNASLPISFSVKASCAGAADAQVEVRITTNAYSVEVVPVAADDLLGTASVRTTRLLFYDGITCADLDLADLAAASAPHRLAHTVTANASWVFEGVAREGSNAVVGQGLDSNTFVQIAGCADIPGASLSETQTMRATLYMDRLFPVPRGIFDVTSDLVLPPSLPALTALQATWGVWSRCGLDPARLWLDCTLDALHTTAADPLDCIPVEESESALGDLVVARRGIVVAPLSSSSSGTGTPSCRGSVDKSGNRSLEAIVDSLFSATRAQLQADNLNKFSDELASLFGEIKLDSQLAIAAGDSVNGYDIDHTLATVSFPDAITPNSLRISELGLPAASAKLQATLKAGQLSLPAHGFTFHLGSVARQAFESTSLKSRGVADALGLVKAVFALAAWKDNSGMLSSCAALSAAVCTEIRQPRDCLTNACTNGLAALAGKLARSFNGLDGDGLDLELSGVAPVVDLNGQDGLADALGLNGRIGTVSAGAGFWSAAFYAHGGNFVAEGAWTATRNTSDRQARQLR